MFPGVATAPSRHDQHAQTVGKIEEMIDFYLAFQPDRVEIHVQRIFHLLLETLIVAPQKHVKRPATSANQQFLAIDFEETVAFVGELTGDLPHSKSQRLCFIYQASTDHRELRMVKIL